MITSPFQILNIISYLETSNEKYDEINIYTFDYWAKCQIDSRYLSILKNKYDINIFKVRDGNSMLREIKKTKRKKKIRIKFTFLCINRPICKLFLISPSADFLIIEDGLGYYADLKEKIKTSFRERGFISAVRTIIGTVFYDNFLRYLISVKKHVLFPEDIEKPNEKYLNGFKRAVSITALDFPKINKPTFIFVSQPLVELGLIKKNSYDEHIKKASTVAAESGMEFYIKPHPSESLNTVYSFNILNYKGSIEELIYANENIKAIGGFTSTSLYTSSILFGTKTFAFDYHLLANLSSSQRNIFNSYVNIIHT